MNHRLHLYQKLSKQWGKTLCLTTEFACLLGFGAFVVRAADRYVVEPGTIENGKDAIPYNTWTNAATNIQWAMNVAAEGETILVSNGTYWLTNQINFTNGITLCSVNGRDVTIINGNYPAYTNRCFLVTNANALVQGFTISNAFVWSSGAGVYLRNGATIRNCIISGNTARDGNGGGVYIDAKGTVDLCAVVGNVATGKLTGGGGIYLASGGTVTNSTIAWNLEASTNTTYSAGGGGVFLYTGGLVQNCAISSNIDQKTTGQGGGGGAMFLTGGSIINTIISANTNASLGSGAFIEAAGTLRNCLISNNRNGGVYISEKGTIQNCTITGNMGADKPGLYFYGWGTVGPLILNCIIVSNYYYNGTLANWSFNNDLANLSVSNTCTYPTNFAAAVQRSGCISNYQAFVNYSAGNYRLEKTSPCVNTGLNQDWMTGSSDLDGRPRIRYGIVDMGAYERIHEGTIYRFH